MPIDLTAERGTPVWVQDRSGSGLPFSKGLMATSILATGVSTELAYRIAAEIQRHLGVGGRTRIGSDELSELAVRIVGEHAGPEAATRYRAWRRAKRAGRPVVICIGGAPGVGKSTVATRLAVRLGITRVVTTDTIREVLRTVAPPTLLPELHVSSFESTDGDWSTTGSAAFDRQARAVVAATIAVATRLVGERRDAILEGVHLLPGLVSEAITDHEMRPIVVERILVLDDEELHRSQLSARAVGEPSRAGERHLDGLPSIRALQRRLVEMALEAKVETCDLAHPGDLTQSIIDGVVTQVEGD